MKSYKITILFLIVFISYFTSNYFNFFNQNKIIYLDEFIEIHENNPEEINDIIQDYSHISFNLKNKLFFFLFHSVYEDEMILEIPIQKFVNYNELNANKIFSFVQYLRIINHKNIQKSIRYFDHKSVLVKIVSDREDGAIEIDFLSKDIHDFSHSLSLKQISIFNDIITNSITKIPKETLHVMINNAHYSVDTLFLESTYPLMVYEERNAQKNIDFTDTLLNNVSLINNLNDKTLFDELTQFNEKYLTHHDIVSNKKELIAQYKINNIEKIDSTIDGVCLTKIPNDIQLSVRKISVIKYSFSEYSISPYSC
jgi:hypothetical protein